MSAVTHSTGPASGNVHLHQLTLIDLKKAFCLTPQEMAEKRAPLYFGERCYANPQGIASIYYLFLSVHSFDKTLTVEKLSQDASFNMAPQVQKDLVLLEKIRHAATSGTSEELHTLLKEAIGKSICKEQLQKIFDQGLWSTIFSPRSSEGSAAKSIADLLATLDTNKRKAEEAPALQKNEPLPKKEKSELERQVAKLFHDEEIARQLQAAQDEELALQLLCKEYSDGDEVAGDEQLARLFQQEEDELSSQQLMLGQEIFLPKGSPQRF